MEMTRFFDYGMTYIRPVQLDAGHRAALLVIDMQYHDASPDHGFPLALERLSPGSMRYYNKRLEEVVIPATQRLITCFRSTGRPIIYLTLGSDFLDYRDLAPRFAAWLRAFERDSDIEGIFWAGNPDAAIRAELAPVPGDTVIRKRTFSGFNTSDLGEILRYQAIDSLVITGVTTNACVESTARDAADLGYGCILAEDAMADYDQDAHDATLRSFHFNFGRVASADDICQAIADGSEI